jgi:hypothetical protein
MAEREDAGSAAPPLLEIGWILDDDLERLDREAALEARERILAAMRGELPEFTWRLPVRTLELVHSPQVEPAELLEAASLELTARRWDFAMLVTPADLRSHYGPAAHAALSSTLCAIVLSTFRIDPAAVDHAATEEARHAGIRDGLHRLALYALGRQGGLPRESRDEDLMTPPRGREQLELAPPLFTPRQRDLLREELERVADERVEEEQDAGRRGRVELVLRALVRNRREILATLRGSRFWEFPFRVARVTTTALSALVILMVTAESWEVGIQIGPRVGILLAACAITLTAVYILQRLRLLALHGSALPTEQIAVARFSVLAFLLVGMATTYALLFAFAAGLGAAVFHPPLVARWTDLPEHAVGWQTYGIQAGWTATLAVLVGALGASFEGQSYLKHFAYVDEEI